MRRFSVSFVIGVMFALGLTGAVHAFPVTFDNLSAKVIFNSGSAPPQPPPFTAGDCPNCPFDITNNTGVTWTDFHMQLQPGPSSFGTFAFINAVAGGYDGNVYDGPGIDALSNPGGGAGLTLDIVGLNIPNGGVYSFTVDMDAFELFGTYDLLAQPTTDGVVPRVPGPATFLLIGAGFLVLGGLSFARRSDA